MPQTAKIKIRNLSELQAYDVISTKNAITPLKKRKNPKSATTSKKLNVQEDDKKNADNANTNTVIKTVRKKLTTPLKETPANQKRIDSYFNSCPKTYEIKIPKEEAPTPFGKNKLTVSTGTAKKSNAARSRNAVKSNKKSPRRPKAGRKRLFTESTETTTEKNMSLLSSIEEIQNLKPIECISIDSDSEKNVKCVIASRAVKNSPPNTITSYDKRRRQTTTLKNSTCTSSAGSSLPFGLRSPKTSCENNETSKSSTSASSFSRRRPKPCPTYKIIENTTFAVDAFQFGYIENVTHYFLTHFHADHYIGLTKSFAMPLYMSPITARLLRSFIPVHEQYIHELELNQPCVINDIEITALDANHCPGAIMLVFKILNTGKCILHTGDFRAYFGMESEPIFWNNNIHTIYLDTTYISDKYAFCTQYESISKAKDLIEKFRVKHPGKRVLYICGSYVIGKEKFWTELAETYDLKVWAEGNRYKALKAINEERFNKLLVEDPNEASMHVIAMGKLTYLELVEYFKLYEHQYDAIFSIRPSGWEKNARPRYSNKINIVGIEYSEHSSYAEMQRFVKFLKPEHVISTVPTGKDLMKTAKVPLRWYKYDKLKSSSNYQPSIDAFLSETPQRKPSIRPPNTNKGGVESFVSPLKPFVTNETEISNNVNAEKAISIHSSKCTETEEILNNVKTELDTSKCSETKRTKNPKNSYNLMIETPALTKTTTSKCSINSTEDFETPDLVFTTNELRSIKKGRQENKTCKKNQTKSSKEQPEIGTNIENMNKEDDAETPKGCQNNKKSNQTTTTNNIKQDYSSEDEFQNKQIMPDRQTTSQKSLGKISEETFKSKKENLKIPTSQKRFTRSKSALSKATIQTISSSEEKAEKEFQAKLLKLTQQNNKINNTKTQPKSTEISSKSQENPIFKSTTTTSMDSISEDELQPTYTLKNKKINTTTLTASEKSSDEIQMDYMTKPVRSKRQAFTRITTPFKKSKPTLDTKAILSTILENNEDINRFNCSQLAGLVMDSLSKQNPDNSKDHIPSDLLSDADDDWM